MIGDDTSNSKCGTSFGGPGDQYISPWPKTETRMEKQDSLEV